MTDYQKDQTSALLLLMVSILSFMLMCKTSVNAQEVLSLDMVLSMVQEENAQVKMAENGIRAADLDFKFYKSQLKPIFNVQASLPDYIKTSTSVVQPNGTIAFQSVEQANSAFSLNANQVISATGGRFFLRSDLTRFDDIPGEFTQFNGIPFRIGFTQPLFGYNPWKYQKQLQPLFKDEAGRQYVTAVEEAFMTATNLYFDILISKQNRDIAITNQEVNERLLEITEERFELGKVSKDEKLQLEIELNNAKLNVSQATFAYENAVAALFTYLGTDEVDLSKDFVLPDVVAFNSVNIPALLATAAKHRPEVIAFQRELVQKEDELARTKNQFGIQADLTASYGFARGSMEVGDIYSDPFDEQQFNLRVSMPIFDWGRKKAATDRVKVDLENISIDYQQQLLELDNLIEQQALRFASLQNEIDLLQSIVEAAEQRFEISNERYILGNIDITNLTLAQREKDQTKRNYINALQTYWVTYFRLRMLSGFDIAKNQEIIY